MTDPSPVTVPNSTSGPPGTEVAERPQVRYDMFDVLRVGAALLVVFHHAFALSGNDAPGNPALGRIGMTYGRLGVAIFFCTSGFLVTRSWALDPSAQRFATKRVRRVWPGLLVMLIVVTFVIGPLASTASARGYFRSRETVEYLFHNFFLAPVHYQLPGVFNDNPAGSDVNGSLWTLPYEILAYITVVALGATRLLQARKVIAAGFVALLVVFELGVARSVLHLGSFHFNGMAAIDLVRLFLLFYGGGMLWLFRDRIALTGRGALYAGAAVVVGFVVQSPVLGICALPYLTIYIGTRPSGLGRALRRLGDPSYGIYIYSFPLQQAIVLGIGGSRPWLLLVLSTPVSVAVGYLSWHAVERPAVRWRRRQVPALAGGPR